MNGRVQQRHALLDVELRLPDGKRLAIEFVIDTGFQGFLALPFAAIAALGLPYRDTISANLANDTDVDLDVYEAAVVWNGQVRIADVLATGRRPLLGASLMDGLHLGIDFVDEGAVNIAELPKTVE